MLFEINQITRYDYTAPVHLGEHLLRFLPPLLAGQRPGRCILDIDPVPARSEDDLDMWGNRIRRVRFQGHTDHLKIRTCLEVETVDTAALPTPGTIPLPVSYGEESVAVAACLQPLEDPARSARLRATAAGGGSGGRHDLSRRGQPGYSRFLSPGRAP